MGICCVAVFASLLAGQALLLLLLCEPAQDDHADARVPRRVLLARRQPLRSAPIPVQRQVDEAVQHDRLHPEHDVQCQGHTAHDHVRHHGGDCVGKEIKLFGVRGGGGNEKNSQSSTLTVIVKVYIIKVGFSNIDVFKVIQQMRELGNEKWQLHTLQQRTGSKGGEHCEGNVESDSGSVDISK